MIVAYHSTFFALMGSLCPTIRADHALMMSARGNCSLPRGRPRFWLGVAGGCEWGI